MKRSIRFLPLISALLMCACVSFAACGEQDKKDGGTDTHSLDASVLVAYFSATGNTEKVAGDIAEVTGGALHEIVPEIPYTEDDLKYYTDCRADREQSDPSARPAIDGGVEDMESYDIIFLGYPIWHGKAPKLIYTFLESYDFSGKTIVPFCTSGSSPISGSLSEIQALADGATWRSGKRFSSDSSQNGIREWIDSLEFQRAV